MWHIHATLREYTSFFFINQAEYLVINCHNMPVKTIHLLTFCVKLVLSFKKHF